MGDRLSIFIIGLRSLVKTITVTFSYIVYDLASKYVTDSTSDNVIMQIVAKILGIS